MRLLFLFVFVFQVQYAYAQTSITGKVIRILDGDTFEILIKENNIRIVRLAHIDAPEKGQDFSKVATQKLRDYIFDKDVKVVFEKKDRNNRLLGNVYVGNEYINMKMVLDGLAWHFKKYSHDKRFAQAETEARKAKKGLWIQPDAKSPWEFRAHRIKQREIEVKRLF